MKYLSGVVLALIACGATAAEYAISVPSDAKAKYSVLEIAGKKPLRTIVTRRQGSSGESFSKREFDCSRGTVRYVGMGDTLVEMRSSKPDGKMAPVVDGSIASVVGGEACK